MKIDEDIWPEGIDYYFGVYTPANERGNGKKHAVMHSVTECYSTPEEARDELKGFPGADWEKTVWRSQKM